MNQSETDNLGKVGAGVLSLAFSVVTIFAVCCCAFPFTQPDGTTTLSEVVLIPMPFAVYLFFTVISAVFIAKHWNAAAPCWAPGWISLIAAIPFLLLAILGRELVLAGIALFTFGIQYVAVQIRKPASKSNDAGPAPQ